MLHKRTLPLTYGIDNINCQAFTDESRAAFWEVILSWAIFLKVFKILRQSDCWFITNHTIAKRRVLRRFDAVRKVHCHPRRLPFSPSCFSLVTTACNSSSPSFTNKFFVVFLRRVSFSQVIYVIDARIDCRFIAKIELVPLCLVSLFQRAFIIAQLVLQDCSANPSNTPLFFLFRGFGACGQVGNRVSAFCDGLADTSLGFDAGNVAGTFGNGYSPRAPLLVWTSNEAIGGWIATHPKHVPLLFSNFGFQEAILSETSKLYLRFYRLKEDCI